MGFFVKRTDVPSQGLEASTGAKGLSRRFTNKSAPDFDEEKYYSI
jgi:hypothetical protein